MLSFKKVKNLNNYSYKNILKICFILTENYVKKVFPKMKKKIIFKIMSVV